MRLAGDVESNPGPYEIINQFKAILIRVITAQKMKFSIKDFFSKCDQIRRKLRIWSHSLKKRLMKNFIFCAVDVALFGGTAGR